MKRTTLKLFALLLAMVMVLALIPSAAFAEGRIKDRRESQPETPKVTGYIPVEIPGTRAVTNAYLRGDMETYYRLSGREATRDTLPSKYDSRDYNYITSVKNQNPYGSCWAHAAMASVESYMIKYGVEVGTTGAAATTSLNLSETQHCFFNYTNAYDAEGMLTGDKSSCSDGCLDQGGNGEMSAYTLQRWAGSASESVSALAYSKASTVASSGLASQYAYGSNVSHVQNSEWIPGSDIEAVKQAIMKYGAGNISYYESGSAYTYTCTKDTTSQESSSHKWANHAITIVGWDDSIATSRFSPNKPSSAGAWLCKNSWGTGYFSQGYMYISYEDTSVLEGSIFFYDAEPIDNYAHNYQYDGTCNVVCYGKGWPSSSDYYVGFANGTKVANVFTATGSQLLEAVALCNWDEAMTYTVEIYKNPTAGNPSSGTLMTSQSGSFTFPGYYTVKLDNPVTLAAGDTFSVVFTQNVAEADEDGNYVHTPYDATFNNSDVVSWASWTHANHGNTSYYKEPNGSWTDCPDNGDYRIKAYTNDLTYVVTAVSNNTAWGTVSVNGTKITATPATGYYVSGYEVTAGTATATINGNVINVAPETDCTIKVIFAPKPTYTVNYQSAGSSAGSTTAQIYDTVTLPSTVSNTPNGWTFIGWISAELPETTTEPTFYEPGAEYTVTANVTLYALFNRLEGTGNLIYRLVNDNLSDWTGNYVITSGKDTSLIALKSITTDQRIENATSGASVAYANTGMTLDGELLRNVAPEYVFHIAPSGSAYTIKNESTGFWIGTQSTYLHNMGSYQTDYSDWNVSYDLYNICMKVANVASTNYTYLVKGSNSYFVVNTGYTTNKTQFWKEEVEGVNYYTTGPEGAHEHTYGEWTSNNDGTHSHACAECGDVVTESCTYNDVVTAPTVTEQGYTTHTCTVCGYTFVDSYVDALGYTVTFSVPAGVTAPAAMNCKDGETISLPTAGAPAGYTFLGWVTEDYTNVSALPTVLTGSYAATADVTLKALYSHTETSAAGYELITEAPESWEGSYVITYGKSGDMTVLKGVAGTKKLEAASAGATAAFADAGMTIDGTALNNVTDAYVFTVTANGDKFVIQNAQTGTYLANRGSYLYSYKTLATSYCLWSFAMAEGAVDATNAASKARPHLTFSTAKNYFMVNSSSADIFFWKLGDAASSTVYTTVIG
ncbi:MAG: InlB B-repeat-containing protein [Clostridia bacterium]|nr:InlB B-repeat-containing protein [Clostridia bacterium]